MRQGRYSSAQARAVETWMPSLGVPFSETALDLDALFGRSAPKILEVGFGMGDTTAEIAAAHPENDYLCIEVHLPGVGNLLKLASEMQLSNLRVIRRDAAEVVESMIPADSLTGIHIFFPDPWPKKRHHKRRLIQPPFTALLASRLKPGAYLHIATDWEDYAQHILSVLEREERLGNTAGGFAPRPPSRPLTRFERRGLALGHQVRDLVFVRKA